MKRYEWMLCLARDRFKRNKELMQMEKLVFIWEDQQLVSSCLRIPLLVAITLADIFLKKWKYSW